MNENMDFSKIRPLTQNDQLANIEKIRSLQKVSEEIQQTIDVVNCYKKKLDTLQPPVVNGEPWYKFSFGKASVEEVNKVLKSFSDFVQNTFKLVATAQNFQNENDINICRLIGLLAIAEANSYEKLDELAGQMTELSSEDEASLMKLKELENSFLQSIKDSEIDSTKKEEQMSRLIEYITLSSESKTKKIRSITLSLSDIKGKLDKYRFAHEEQEEKLGSMQTFLDESLKNIKEENFAMSVQQERFMEQSKKQAEQAFADMKSKYTEEAENLRQQQMKSLECLKTDLDDGLKKIEDSTKVMEKNQEQFIKESKEATVQHYAELQKKYEDEAMHLHKEQEEKLGSMQTFLDESLKNIKEENFAMSVQQERFMEQSKEQAEQAFAEVKKYDNIFKEEQQDVINKLVNQITYYKITAISAGAISIASALYTFLI